MDHCNPLLYGRQSLTGFFMPTARVCREHEKVPALDYSVCEKVSREMWKVFLVLCPSYVWTHSLWVWFSSQSPGLNVDAKLTWLQNVSYHIHINIFMTWHSGRKSEGDGVRVQGNKAVKPVNPVRVCIATFVSSHSSFWQKHNMFLTRPWDNPRCVFCDQNR